MIQSCKEESWTEAVRIVVEVVVEGKSERLKRRGLYGIENNIRISAGDVKEMYNCQKWQNIKDEDDRR